MYEIIHYSYCGMKIPRDLYATKEEAHAKMKSIARFYNKRFGCEITWRGPQNIEIHEPENWKTRTSTNTARTKPFRSRATTG
jgi:hypothetical protein